MNADNETPTPNPRLVAIGIVVVVAVLGLIGFHRLPIGSAASEEEKREDPKPPELFDGIVPCSRPHNPSNRAAEATEAGLAKMERYPFEARDGVAAVRLLLEAKECHAAAYAGTRAFPVRERLESWIQRIRRDYRSRRLRLRLALQNDDRRTALREVRSLRKLLAHRDGDYPAWLAGLERRLIEYD
jgi:hypothetical protein